MSGNQVFRGRSRGPSECGAAATMGAGTGAGGLKSKMVLRICWRSSSDYLTMEEFAEPEAVNGVMTGTASRAGASVAAGAGVQQSLPSMEVLPASLSLPL